VIIDLHAHHFPADYMAFAARNGLTGITAPRRAEPRFAPALPPLPRPKLGDEDLGRRFEAMSAAGVGRQVLSPSTAPYLDDRDEAVRGARTVNDAYAALHAAHPETLGFWTSLPLPHVEASLAEMERGWTLGASGVVLQCFCLNESVVRDEFDPLFAALDRRKASVFLHPCQNGLCSHLVNEWGLTVCAGASMEDSVVAMHLIVKQIPRRYPDIRFIVPHFGGLLPMLLNRLDGQMAQPDFAERPSVTARRFFYDTVGWGSKAALVAAVEAFGVDRLVPGSDWPFLLGWESYRRTFDHIRGSGLPADSIARILHANALAALGLDAAG
jgi:aminocarboxymuconate-semialdehyde decarboxylase